MKTIKLILFAVFVSSFSNTYAQPSDTSMYAHFIDVGQAQATLLEFPEGAILIDAGAQPEYEIALINYLTKFFSRRPDLHNTLDAVIITHQHIDHNAALDDLKRNFKIKNYIDNGHHKKTKDEVNQIWMQNNAATFGINYATSSFEKIISNRNANGYTNNVIDPVGGSVIDPKIILLSGALDQRPADWTEKNYKNENNHSLIIKVIFGKASFLFMGDLEEKGIKTIIDYYRTGNALDADVLQVGHHGSKNATTSRWLRAVTPQYAVISCGKWDYGKRPDGTPTIFTTYAYAHPNIKAITLLEKNIPGLRPIPVTNTIGVTGSFNGSIPIFKQASITHNVYATPWDKTIIIKADANGKYQLSTQN